MKLQKYKRISNEANMTKKQTHVCFSLTEAINNSADHHFIGQKVRASKEIPLNFTTIGHGIG